MSWVYPVSEAARTTRLGVVAAFAWTGVALLAAGAAATLVVGLSESGVVPWLALGGGLYYLFFSRGVDEYFAAVANMLFG